MDEERQDQSENGAGQPSTCAICLDRLAGTLSATACGHVFHTVCLEQWLKTRKLCPQCKGPVSQRTPAIRLYVGDLTNVAPTEEDIERDLQAGNPTANISQEQLQRLNDRLGEAEASLRFMQGDLLTAREEVERAKGDRERLCEKVNALQASLSAALKCQELLEADLSEERTCREETAAELASANHKLQVTAFYRDVMDNHYTQAEKDLSLDPGLLEYSKEELRKANAWLSRELQKLHRDHKDIMAVFEKNERKCMEAVRERDKAQAEVTSIEQELASAEECKKVLRQRVVQLQKRLEHRKEGDDRPHRTAPAAGTSVDATVQGSQELLQLSLAPTQEKSVHLAPAARPAAARPRPGALDADIAHMAKKAKSRVWASAPTKAQHLAHSTIFMGSDGMGGTKSIFSKKTVPGATIRLT